MCEDPEGFFGFWWTGGDDRPQKARAHHPSSILSFTITMPNQPPYTTSFIGVIHSGRIIANQFT
jgi:hypothetical protein